MRACVRTCAQARICVCVRACVRAHRRAQACVYFVCMLSSVLVRTGVHTFNDVSWCVSVLSFAYAVCLELFKTLSLLLTLVTREPDREQTWFRAISHPSSSSQSRRHTPAHYCRPKAGTVSVTDSSQAKRSKGAGGRLLPSNTFALVTLYVH